MLQLTGHRFTSCHQTLNVSFSSKNDIFQFKAPNIKMLKPYLPLDPDSATMQDKQNVLFHSYEKCVPWSAFHSIRDLPLELKYLPGVSQTNNIGRLFLGTTKEHHRYFLKRTNQPREVVPYYISIPLNEESHFIPTGPIYNTHSGDSFACARYISGYTGRILSEKPTYFRYFPDNTMIRLLTLTLFMNLTDAKADNFIQPINKALQLGEVFNNGEQPSRVTDKLTFIDTEFSFPEINRHKPPVGSLYWRRNCINTHGGTKGALCYLAAEDILPLQFLLNRHGFEKTMALPLDIDLLNRIVSSENEINKILLRFNIYTHQDLKNTNHMHWISAIKERAVSSHSLLTIADLLLGLPN
ncbi:MAG: hypothetical protein ACO3K7_05735 [Candidatus Marinamargulisbacteria bacterium]